MSLIRSIYRSVLSDELRLKLYQKRNAKREKKIASEVINYLNSPENIFPENEAKKIASFLKNNGLHVFPYSFSDKYKPENVEVMHDQSVGLNYVLHGGKKLYFKRQDSITAVKQKYSFLLNEQDAESPHQYLNADFNVSDQSVVVDVGAAEGIFVLPIIDRVKHVYLFETDDEWIEALNATFKDHKEKVTIINKYVSDKDDEMNIKLDTYFSDKKVDFIKIDVDGAEQNLLNGAVNLLKNTEHLKVAICTYHKQNDEIDFNKLLNSYNFATSTTSNYMLFYFDENFKAPYLRRGIIRAKK